MTAFFRVLVLFLLTVPLAAQEAPHIPATLQFAVTGGRFQTDSVQGPYRVLVFTGGSDHVISDFFLQWMREESASDTVSLVSSVPIKEINGAWLAAGSPVVTRTSTGTEITIEMIDSHFEVPGRRKCVVKPGPPSRYTIRCDR